jgi:hypothetical protein
MHNPAAVQLAQNNPTRCHSEASLSARNRLATSSEAADSSRDMPRFGMTISWEFFKSHPYEKPTNLSFSAEKGRRTITEQQRITIFYAIAYEPSLTCS